MIDLDELARMAVEHNLKLPVSNQLLARNATSSALALFHEPLLAMVIALMSHHRKGDLRTSEASVWTAAALANCYFGLRTQHRLMLEWTATFRERVAAALVVLETLSWIQVEGVDRNIVLTERGKETVRKLLAADGETGRLAKRLQRSCADAVRLGLELL